MKYGVGEIDKYSEKAEIMGRLGIFCFSTTTILNQGNQIKKFSKREKSFLRRFSIDQLLKRIHQKFVSLSSDGWLKAFERLDQKPELFH